MAQWFPTNNNLPAACTKEYQLKIKLGQGLYGVVYEACKNSRDCRYVAKVVPLTIITPQQFRQEVQITQLMGRNRVGPIVQSAWICNWKQVGGPYNFGVIVMNKADITLYNYLE